MRIGASFYFFYHPHTENPNIFGVITPSVDPGEIPFHLRNRRLLNPRDLNNPEPV